MWGPLLRGAKWTFRAPISSRSTKSQRQWRIVGNEDRTFWMANEEVTPFIMAHKKLSLDFF